MDNGHPIMDTDWLSILLCLEMCQRRSGKDDVWICTKASFLSGRRGKMGEATTPQSHLQTATTGYPHRVYRHLFFRGW